MPNNTELIRGIALFQVILSEVLAPPLICGLLGYYFYYKLHWPKGVIIVLGLLGLVVGFIRIYHVAMRMSADDEKRQ